MIQEIFKEEKIRKIEFEIKSFNFEVNSELHQHLMIFEKGSSDISIFTDFFFDKVGSFSLLNHSYNTKLNFYGYSIVKFLNFCFNESLTPINKIENLRIEMVEEFLNLYSQGRLKSDNTNKWRNSETVIRANHSITHFIYWLYSKKTADKSKKKFNMKYIKSTDFTYTSVTFKSRSGKEVFKKKKVDNIATPILSKSISKRQKVTRANLYSVLKLIELSETQDPMLTFGLVLGAFVGLRVGDVCQMCRERLQGFDKEYAGLFIHLTGDLALRSDAKITSNIKTKRTLSVYEAFEDIVKKYYNKHMQFLIEEELNTNIYGAIFLNKNGIAMSYKSYLNRFDKLYNLLYQNIIKEATQGNKKAIIEKEIIEEGRFTPHSLRYFYTQFIEDVEEGNPFLIQKYRGDKSIKSQEVYKKGSTAEQIRNIQDKLFEEIKLIKEGEK